MDLVMAESSAVFSPCRRYRYLLRRVFSEGPAVLFVGLNPSVADEYRDDPTIRRCIGFAKRWGYGTLLMANLYAWCATQPRGLRSAECPIGESGPGGNVNDAELRTAARSAGLIVVAWGADIGPVPERAAAVAELLRAERTDGEVWTLGLTKAGLPRHPLFVRSDAVLVPFRGPMDGCPVARATGAGLPTGSNGNTLILEPGSDLADVQEVK